MIKNDLWNDATTDDASIFPNLVAKNVASGASTSNLDIGVNYYKRYCHNEAGQGATRVNGCRTPARTEYDALSIPDQKIRTFKFNGYSQFMAIEDKFFSGFEAQNAWTVGVWFKTPFGSGGSASVPEFANWAFLDFDRSEFMSLWIDNGGMLRFSSSHSNKANKGSALDTKEDTGALGGLEGANDGDMAVAVMTASQGVFPIRELTKSF